MKVIFVCTGNTCRSPMAEAMARSMAAERGLNVSFASSGTGANEGSSATDSSILVGLERGLDLSRHRSRALSTSAITDDTIVLALASSHVPAIRAAVPNARVYLLDEYASNGASRRSVADPFGGDLDEYRRAADEIEEMLDRALDRMASETSAGSA